LRATVQLWQSYGFFSLYANKIRFNRKKSAKKVGNIEETVDLGVFPLAQFESEMSTWRLTFDTLKNAADNENYYVLAISDVGYTGFFDSFDLRGH